MATTIIPVNATSLVTFLSNLHIHKELYSVGESLERLTEALERFEKISEQLNKMKNRSILNLVEKDDEFCELIRKFSKEDSGEIMSACTVLTLNLARLDAAVEANSNVKEIQEDIDE